MKTSKHYENKKHDASEDWVIIETIVKHSIKILEC